MVPGTSGTTLGLKLSVGSRAVCEAVGSPDPYPHVHSWVNVPLPRQPNTRPLFFRKYKIKKFSMYTIANRCATPQTGGEVTGTHRQGGRHASLLRLPPTASPRLRQWGFHLQAGVWQSALWSFTSQRKRSKNDERGGFIMNSPTSAIHSWSQPNLIYVLWA